AMGLTSYTQIHIKNEVASALGAIPAACDANSAGPTNTPTLTPSFTPTASNTPTNTATRTFTPSITPGGPTLTPTFTPTPANTPSLCLDWHPATDQGPGYFAQETCGLPWEHLHVTPTPILP